MYASQRPHLKGQNMLAVVMQGACRKANEWTGPVGLVLGPSLFIDFSNPSTWSDQTKFDAKVDELSQAIRAKIGPSGGDAGGSSESISALLESLNLSNYAAKFHEEGADEVGDLKKMSNDELAETFAMKRFHAKRLYEALNPAAPRSAPSTASSSHPQRPSPAHGQPPSPPTPSPEWILKAKDPENLFNAARAGDL